MTTCRVICHDCRPGAGPLTPAYPSTPGRVWRHNCLECAENQLAAHRRDTGHADIEMRVVADDTLEMVNRAQRRGRNQGRRVI